MNTLIIEPNTKVDYQLFVSLAKRLNVTFREEKAKAKKAKQAKEEALLAKTEHLKKEFKDAAFFALAGTFEGIDADLMIKEIEESRTIKEIDTSWTN
jgi:hypothetical protein